MKKGGLFFAVLAAAGLMLMNSSGLSAGNHDAPLPSPLQVSHPITTTGDAEIKVAPDEVIFVLGVETWDKDIKVAKKQNDDRIRRIIAVTKEYAIEPQHVQTDQISVDPRYRNGSYTDADFIGFFVSKTVAVTLKDISKFEDVYTAVLSAGANHVQGIQFRTTDLRKYRDQARALAIQAAQEKAAALAGAMGQKIGKPQSIQENSSGWMSSYGARWGGAMTQNVIQNSSSGSTFGDEGTFAPGQISISARVSVTFELE
jgi:uncharacterized protein